MTDKGKTIDINTDPEAVEIDAHIKMSKYIQAVKIIQWCMSQTDFGSKRYDQLIELREWAYARVGMCATAISASLDKEGK